MVWPLNPDSKRAGCYQVADAPRASDCRNWWFDQRDGRDAGKAISPMPGLKCNRRGACENRPLGLVHGRVTESAGGAVNVVRAATVAAVVGSALLRLSHDMTGLSMMCVWVTVRVMGGVCCNSHRSHGNCVGRVMCGRAFHGHGVASQTTKGQQEHHEQGKKAAHGLNDTGRRGLVPRQWQF